MKKKYLQIGEVFTTAAFNKARRETVMEEGKAAVLDMEKPLHLDTFGNGMVGYYRTEYSNLDPSFSKKYLTSIDTTDNDELRADAEWVVERDETEGGGTGMGPHDVYPDGHHVTARRLNDDGTYNPDGETIQFYQSGCFTGMVEPDKITLVRKMERQFTEPTP